MDNSKVVFDVSCDFILYSTPNERSVTVIENYECIRDFIRFKNVHHKYDAKKDILMLIKPSSIIRCPFYSKIKQYIINGYDRTPIDEQIKNYNMKINTLSMSTPFKIISYNSTLASEVRPPAETPAETPVQTPAETPVQTPAETPVQTPAETLATSAMSALRSSPIEDIPVSAFGSSRFISSNSAVGSSKTTIGYFLPPSLRGSTGKPLSPSPKPSRCGTYEENPSARAPIICIDEVYAKGPRDDESSPSVNKALKRPREDN